MQAHSFTAKPKLFSGEFCTILAVVLSELQTSVLDKIIEKMWAKLLASPDVTFVQHEICQQSTDNEDPHSNFFLSQEAFNGLQQKFVDDGFTLMSVKLN